MLNPKAYENSRPDGFGVLEIVDEKELRLFVPLKRTELSGEVTGPLASLRLTQVYGYSREQCDKTLEAVYRFPLPGDAAVTSVVVSFGEVEITAELKERQQAEADYEAAKQAGQQAALATRESPDVFTLQVAGLQPDQDITVVTSYVQLARVEGDDWSLRIPLTTAPRYVRSDELTSRYAAGQPLALLRDPGYRFQLDLTVRGVDAVTSRTHPLSATPNDDGVQVRLQDGEVLPDRDCVLAWQPRKAADKASMQVWLHDDATANQLYFLALVAPPATRTTHRTPREVTLLVDHSGSMEGAKWQASDWAVESFLLGLKEHDAFALGLFHNTTRWFEKGMKRADAATVNQAVQFLKQHKDSGGTELGVALEQALSLTRVNGDPARHILLITDAEVTDEGRILRLAEEESQRKDRRRISVLCIDAAPNSHLALELAERGGGLAKFLTSNPAEEDITTALDEVLADWAEPVLPNLRLEVNRAEAQAAGRDVRSSKETSVIDLGDLPAGRAVWVVGRVPRAAQLAFKVKASNDWDVAACELKSKSESHPAIKALFGARKVLGLEFLMHAHYGPDELRARLQRMGYDATQQVNPPAKVYAENVRADANAMLRDLLVSEALNYGIACSETAFVAVRKEAGQVIAGSVAVANALPSGWSDAFVMYNLGSASVSGAMPLPAMAAMPSPAPARRARHTGSSGSVFGSLKKFFASSSDDVDDLSLYESAPAASMDEIVSSAPEDQSIVLFSGTPQVTNSEAVLFDSTQQPTRLPERGTITTLTVQFTDGAPANLDASLSLLLFVDDLSTPRARVRLADLLRQGGTRPVNLLKQRGQVVRLLLSDPNGAWANGAPKLTVALTCI
jgi:Ca-activated chloride channel family protein